MSYPIQEAYALVMEDSAGNEGLPPVMEITATLRGLPLLCGNALTHRTPPLEHLKPIYRRLYADGFAVKLLRFTRRVEVTPEELLAEHDSGPKTPLPLRMSELWCAARVQADGMEVLGGLTISQGPTRVMVPTAGGDADRLMSLISRDECRLIFAAGQHLFRLTRREELT